MIQPSKPETIEFPDHVQHVAIAGDWHGNLQYAKKVIDSLPGEVEVLLHTGDFGYKFADDFLNAVNKSARQNDLIVMFVDGNHEDHDLLDFMRYENSEEQSDILKMRPRVWHLPRGFRWEWFGIKFLALGGAHSVDRRSRTPGASWWSQEIVSYADMLRAIDGGPADVMISHDTVEGYHIPGLLPANMFPREDLEMAENHRINIGTVAREVGVKYIWHGHYHSRYVREHDGMIITGLDCDGSSFNANVVLVDLAELEV